MKILITGGMGFVGRHLTRFFLDKGHELTVIGLRPAQKLFTDQRFSYLSADTTQKGPWLDQLNSADVIINLAGKTVFKRWTRRYKNQIYDSRILTTRNLVDAMPSNRKIVFCSTSATGYYGDCGDTVLTENAPSGHDFLAGVGRDWEAEACLAEKKGVRVAIARFGIILGPNGGIMEKIIPPFKLYAGGPLGSGLQWFPWMHIEDLTAGFNFILENKDVHGTLNFCSPNPVRNIEFVKALGRILKRPALVPTPAFAIRLAMGEFGSAILCSQRAVGQKLLDHGFRFRYPEIDAAIENIVEKYQIKAS